MRSVVASGRGGERGEHLRGQIMGGAESGQSLLRRALKSYGRRLSHNVC